MLSQAAIAQVAIKGTVLEKKSNQAVPFVSIGIIGKTIGTVSDENGIFDLQLANIPKNDSLKFLAIGYKPAVYLLSDFVKENNKKIVLEELPQLLEEVVIKSKKIKYKTLGTTKYTKNNCTGFADLGGNWRGSEAAILVKNNKNVLIESFSFFVIQNKYSDSLLFRLMFYEKIKNDWVGKTFLRKPVIFKMGTKQGEFTLALKDYNIRHASDFFISLECLMDEMDITKFCYSSSIATSSYYKVKAFSKWHNTKGTHSGGGGADFNVKVSYTD